MKNKINRVARDCLPLCMHWVLKILRLHPSKLLKNNNKTPQATKITPQINRNKIENKTPQKHQYQKRGKNELLQYNI